MDFFKKNILIFTPKFGGLSLIGALGDGKWPRPRSGPARMQPNHCTKNNQ